MKFLLPLDSRVFNTQGFAVLDCSTKQLEYVESHEKYPYLRKGFRGACILNDVVYVCNSFSVKAYKINIIGLDLRFTLLWQLQRPEWLVGRAANADLHHIHYCSCRGVLLLANSFMDSIDEISLDGRFLKREFLWEVSEKINELVVMRNASAPDLCHINHISSAFGFSFLTLGNLNLSRKGGVVCRETGAFVINGLSRPHDGVFWKDEFWLTETSANRLRVYSGIKSQSDFSNSESRCIDLSAHISSGGQYWCRGLHVEENNVFLGCSQFQDRQADCSSNPPSKILQINKMSGEVVDCFEISGTSKLKNPVIYSLLPFDFQ